MLNKTKKKEKYESYYIKIINLIDKHFKASYILHLPILFSFFIFTIFFSVKDKYFIKILIKEEIIVEYKIFGI